MSLTPAKEDPNRESELARKKREPETFGDDNKYGFYNPVVPGAPTESIDAKVPTKKKDQ